MLKVKPKFYGNGQLTKPIFFFTSSLGVEWLGGVLGLCLVGWGFFQLEIFTSPKKFLVYLTKEPTLHFSRGNLGICEPAIKNRSQRHRNTHLTLCKVRACLRHQWGKLTVLPCGAFRGFNVLWHFAEPHLKCSGFEGAATGSGLAISPSPLLYNILLMIETLTNPKCAVLAGAVGLRPLSGEKEKEEITVTVSTF